MGEYCQKCHSKASPVRPYPSATICTHSMNFIPTVMVWTPQRARGNSHKITFASLMAIKLLISISFNRSFDIKRIRWQIFQPLAFRMQQISAIELNGLMYLTGTVDRSENDTSNFWCYDPYRNVWSEKACIELGGAKIVLCKAQRSIFVCNHHVGFLLYDETLDEWVKVRRILLVISPRI